MAGIPVPFADIAKPANDVSPESFACFFRRDRKLTLQQLLTKDSVANEQRQQRKFIDDGASFRKAGVRYAGLESKLPKASATEGS
jgi:hypothetical protein